MSDDETSPYAPSDATLWSILTQTRTIAVVGLSSKPHRDSYGVARYLQHRGYKVVPVNPNETEVLGETAYPSLLDVPTDVGQELYDTARALYDALGLDRARIRLVGVRAERLIDAGSAPQQLELGAREHGRRDAELAADRAARRFGAGAVRPATLLRRHVRPGG